MQPNSILPDFQSLESTAMPKAGNLMHTHLNPFAAPAYEISRLKAGCIRQTVYI